MGLNLISTILLLLPLVTNAALDWMIDDNILPFVKLEGVPEHINHTINGYFKTFLSTVNGGGCSQVYDFDGLIRQDALDFALHLVNDEGILPNNFTLQSHFIDMCPKTELQPPIKEHYVGLSIVEKKSMDQRSRCERKEASNIELNLESNFANPRFKSMSLLPRTEHEAKIFLELFRAIDISSVTILHSYVNKDWLSYAHVVEKMLTINGICVNKVALANAEQLYTRHVIRSGGIYLVLADYDEIIMLLASCPLHQTNVNTVFFGGTSWGTRRSILRFVDKRCVSSVFTLGLNRQHLDGFNEHVLAKLNGLPSGKLRRVYTKFTKHLRRGSPVVDQVSPIIHAVHDYAVALRTYLLKRCRENYHNLTCVQKAMYSPRSLEAVEWLLKGNQITDPPFNHTNFAIYKAAQGLLYETVGDWGGQLRPPHRSHDTHILPMHKGKRRRKKGRSRSASGNSIRNVRRQKPHEHHGNRPDHDHADKQSNVSSSVIQVSIQASRLHNSHNNHTGNLQVEPRLGSDSTANLSTNGSSTITTKPNAVHLHSISSSSTSIPSISSRSKFNSTKRVNLIHMAFDNGTVTRKSTIADHEMHSHSHTQPTAKARAERSKQRLRPDIQRNAKAMLGLPEDGPAGSISISMVAVSKDEKSKRKKTTSPFLFQFESSSDKVCNELIKYEIQDIIPYTVKQYFARGNKNGSKLYDQEIGQPFCKVGEIKKSVMNSKCDWNCRSCPDTHIVVNGTICEACPYGMYPCENRLTCQLLSVRFMEIDDPIVVGLIVFGLIGLLMTWFVIGIFASHNQTKVVKSSSRELSYVMLLGISLCFALPVLYLLKPTSFSCGLQRVYLGLSFTMCYAALLWKTNQIKRVFNAASQYNLNPSFTSTKAQVYFSIGLIVLQILLGISWNALKPSVITKRVSVNQDHIYYTCGSNSNMVFLDLSVPLCLIFACTYLGYKNRDLPKTYNDSKQICLTMYTTCLLWVVFLPMYVIITSSNPFMAPYLLCGASQSAAMVTLIGLFHHRVFLLLTVKTVVLEQNLRVFAGFNSNNNKKLSVNHQRSKSNHGFNGDEFYVSTGSSNGSACTTPLSSSPVAFSLDPARGFGGDNEMALASNGKRKLSRLFAPIQSIEEVAEQKSADESITE